MKLLPLLIIVKKNLNLLKIDMIFELRKIKKVVKLFIPPILPRALASLRDRVSDVDVMSSFYGFEGHNIHPAILKYVNGSHYFSISFNKLSYRGGVSVTSKLHPFQIFYNNGVESLREYYSLFQPGNVFERHGLTSENKKVDNDIDMPWLSSRLKLDGFGEGNIPISEGVRDYGPVSERKLSFEVERLEYVLEAIKRNGFKINIAKQFPRGYFMVRKNGDWIFNVTGGGCHRVAAMSFLGYDEFYFSFEPGYPRIVYEVEACFWPFVRSGDISENDALRVFLSYF